MKPRRSKLLLYHPKLGPRYAKTKPVGEIKSAGRVSVIRRSKGVERVEPFDLFVDESGNTWARKSRASES